jgi:hypothetical protein
LTSISSWSEAHVVASSNTKPSRYRI